MRVLFFHETQYFFRSGESLAGGRSGKVKSEWKDEFIHLKDWLSTSEVEEAGLRFNVLNRDRMNQIGRDSNVSAHSMQMGTGSVRGTLILRGKMLESNLCKPDWLNI